MNSGPDMRTLDLRHYLRRLRNLLVTLLMLGVFAQLFGVPRFEWHSDVPSVRLGHLDQPVWIHAYNASVFVWTRVAQELHR